MKIVNATAIPIRIALKQPFKIAVGSLTHTNHVLVKLTDDQGREGWGETTTFHSVYGYDQKSLYHVLTDHLLPAVIGLDPRNICLIHQLLDRAIPNNLMAKAGVDLAVYDLVGRAFNLPIWALIGGRRMDRVPMVGVVGIISPEQAARDALEQVALGFDTIKIKIGLDGEEDVSRVEAVRKAVGDRIKLRVDGNTGYDLDTALWVFQRMEPFRLEWIEQPLPGWDLDGMARLTRDLQTPIAVDESMYTDHDAYRCLKTGATRVVNIKVAKCGGIYRAQKIAAVAAAAGANCFLGGCIETTPGMAASVHFYAATPGVISGAEVNGPSHYVDDIVKQPMDMVKNAVRVPDTPGLGVEIDLDKVRQYTVTF